MIRPAEPPIVDAASPCLAVSPPPHFPAPGVTLKGPMRRNLYRQVRSGDPAWLGLAGSLL